MNDHELDDEPITTSVGLTLTVAPMGDVGGNLAATVGESLLAMLTVFYPQALCKKANVVITELVQNVIDNVNDPASQMRVDLRIDGDALQVQVTNKATPEQFQDVKDRVEQLTTSTDPKRLFADTLRARRMQRLRGGLGLIRLVSENRFRLSATYSGEQLTMQAVFPLRGAQ
ncbi:ATP-binding protein [Nannocystis bainbridge]|uniref:ATP-binding protein n=1 Tax=Nannocystis bainbridge TaxID=2995303 RepID=A0ABT5E0E0_9BACT|nr:ATP-binding protein [Nannocystis bainbridge]MDC0719347.1 ATP-binding protein [Nannocystis bainbridge]